MTARRLFGCPEDSMSRVTQMVQTGLYRPPIWYSAVRRCPPVQLFGHPHPGRITFPEDRLYPSLYQRIPSLQDEALYVTSLYEATVGRRVAQRWQEEIDKTPGKDEDVAWTAIMRDEQVQAMLASYERRIADGRAQPITAGNVSRHFEKKMQAIGAMRKLSQQATAEHRRQELERGLDLIRTAGAVSQPPPMSDSFSPPAAADPAGGDRRFEVWHELTADRRGLQQQGRQWLVPDMTAVHRLRFVLAPPEPELNDAYHQHLRSPPQSHKLRSRPLPDNTEGDNSLQWALSHAVAHPDADLPDWIAYCLRVQVLTLRRYDLLPWTPYTNCIDAQLWRQARVVLRCRRVEALQGDDMQGKQPAALHQQLASALRDGRPLVYHDHDAPLGNEEQVKHALLLAFVHDALARHQFSMDELEAREPPPPPPPPVRQRRAPSAASQQAAQFAFNIKKSQSRLASEAM